MQGTVRPRIAAATMHTPDNPGRDPQSFWAHIDQAAVLRLQQLDQDIEAAQKALKQQLVELCALLARDPEIVAERGLNRLLVVLEHSAHLTRHSMALVDERHQLLRW